MNEELFTPELWSAALDRYTDATCLAVELFDLEARLALRSARPVPLTALFSEYGVDPHLFDECARQCLAHREDRIPLVVSEAHGLSVVGVPLSLDGVVVGIAVAGYALDRFTQVPTVQRWATAAGVPFQRLWEVARGQTPLPARRLRVNGELLQVLGEALLRENHRTRQLENTARELQEADVAKDEFLAVLSHELRTPLTAIVGWSNILQRTPTPENLARGTRAIERNAFMQDRMIEDLLDVSRIKQKSVTLEFEVVALRPLLEAALEASAAERERKSIRLRLSDGAESLYVRGDTGRLQQVFRNVIGNAVKFTPVNGSLEVSVTAAGEQAVIVVQDSGVGIAPDFLPFVFELFRQQEQGSRRQHPGLGIGLALVKHLVELHDGSVAVTSAGKDLGTAVTLRLPVVEAARLPAEKSLSAPLLGTALEGVSVLVVEDTADSRESLKELLRLLGADVAVAGDGREALDVAAHVDPDVVLCDLHMPVMDGFEFLREFDRKSPHHAPVLAVSALASTADIRRSAEAGFQAHLTKPLNLTSMVAAMTAAIEERA